MFNSSAIFVVSAIFPAFFIIKIAGLYENKQFSTVINYLNEKAGVFLNFVILAWSLYTLYFVSTNQVEMVENPVIYGIAYFALLTVSNLGLYSGFGVLMLLFGNVIGYAAMLKAMQGFGGFYYLVMFNAVYCVYSLMFLNLHNLARFFNIKINEGKC